jgi:hypothetical protein
MRILHQIWVFALQFQLKHQQAALITVGRPFRMAQSRRVKRTQRFLVVLQHHI